jgi:hypothetical protein
MREIAISMHDECYAEITHFCTEANQAQNLIKFRSIKMKPSHERISRRRRIHGETELGRIFGLKQMYRLGNDDIVVVVVGGNLYDDEDDEYYCVGSVDYPSLRGSCPGTAILSLYYLDARSTFMQDLDKEWGTLTEPERARKKSDSILVIILAAITLELTGFGVHDSCGCILDDCIRPADLMASLQGSFSFCTQRCLPALERDPFGLAIVQIAKRLTEHPYRPGLWNFAFVGNDKLRQIIGRDWAELQGIKSVPSVKSRLILAGGLIEALLLDALQETPAQALSSTKGDKEPIDRWTLERLIDVAVDRGRVSPGVRTFAHAVRDYRNLVHPGKEIKPDCKCKVATEEAEIAEHVLEMVIRDLRAEKRY